MRVDAMMAGVNSPANCCLSAAGSGLLASGRHKLRMLGAEQGLEGQKPVEHILPHGVPLRQFVLTLPFELRAGLAYDKKLLGAVGRIFVDTPNISTCPRGASNSPSFRRTARLLK